MKLTRGNEKLRNSRQSGRYVHVFSTQFLTKEEIEENEMTLNQLQNFDN